MAKSVELKEQAADCRLANNVLQALDNQVARCLIAETLDINYRVIFDKITNQLKYPVQDFVLKQVDMFLPITQNENY
jgi:hypothetical protein